MSSLYNLILLQDILVHHSLKDTPLAITFSPTDLKKMLQHTLLDLVASGFGVNIEH